MELDESKADKFEDARASALFWLVTPTVVATRVSGHVARGALSFYTQRVDRILASRPRIHVFHDWRDITGFESDVRAPYRDWAIDKDLSIAPTFLVKSRVLAMALSVSALVIKRELEVLSNAAEFSLRLRAAVTGSRATPFPPRSGGKGQL